MAWFAIISANKTYQQNRSMLGKRKRMREVHENGFKEKPLNPEALDMPEAVFTDAEWAEFNRKLQKERSRDLRIRLRIFFISGVLIFLLIYYLLFII